jgi:hypothetical protein
MEGASIGKNRAAWTVPLQSVWHGVYIRMSGPWVGDLEPGIHTVVCITEGQCITFCLETDLQLKIDQSDFIKFSVSVLKLFQHNASTEYCH